MDRVGGRLHPPHSRDQPRRRACWDAFPRRGVRHSNVAPFLKRYLFGGEHVDNRAEVRMWLEQLVADTLEAEVSEVCARLFAGELAADFFGSTLAGCIRDDALPLAEAMLDTLSSARGDGTTAHIASESMLRLMARYGLDYRHDLPRVTYRGVRRDCVFVQIDCQHRCGGCASRPYLRQ
jgi:hypothetical protein